ncbi:MAG: response regulator transcription factor [Chloroflexi bacterium]|nr:response regulator transcription factor [Chloroflexota bacterium]
MSEQRRILIVDDEPDLVHAIRLYLEEEGYMPFSAQNGAAALEVLRERLPDLVVLDVQMPKMDGFETLKRIREVSQVPVIMLTVRSAEQDKVRGLKMGADDYVTKPFSQRELLSRIEAVLRRAETPPHVAKTEVRVDDYLQIDFSRNEVIAGGKVVQLSPTEYRLLYHLVSSSGRVLTYETLLSKVWGWEYREEQHYVRLYISYLRQKIEPEPSHPKYILTEKGLGYRFVDFRQQRQASQGG